MKKIFLFFMLGILLLSFFTSATNIEKKSIINDGDVGADGVTEYWAALIAAGKYGPGLAPSRWLVNDTIGVKNSLLNYGWKKENIKHEASLIGLGVTRKKILNAIDWLELREDEDDVVLMFFSIHGYYQEDKYPFDELDGKDESIYPSYGSPITDDELGVLLNKFESKQIIVIFNACYAGGMIDGNMDLKGEGRVILTSSNADETSIGFYHGEHENSIFSYYLIEGLKGPADKNNDKNISVEEIFEYAAARTTSYANKQGHLQNPQIYDAYPTQENNDYELNIIDLEKKDRKREVDNVFLRLFDQFPLLKLLLKL